MSIHSSGTGPVESHKVETFGRKAASHPSGPGLRHFPRRCSWKPTTLPLRIRRCEAAPPSPDGQPGRTPDEIRSLSTQLSQRARLHETGDRVPARAFRRPQEVQEGRVGGTPLKGKNIALIFEKASTRTRCAFE